MFAAINMKFYGKANLHLHLTLRDTLNQSETRPAAYFVFPHIFSIAVIYTVIMGLQPEILIKENIHTYTYYHLYRMVKALKSTGVEIMVSQNTLKFNAFDTGPAQYS